MSYSTFPRSGELTEQATGSLPRSDFVRRFNDALDYNLNPDADYSATQLARLAELARLRCRHDLAEQCSTLLQPEICNPA